MGHISCDIALSACFKRTHKNITITKLHRAPLNKKMPQQFAPLTCLYVEPTSHLRYKKNSTIGYGSCVGRAKCISEATS